MKLRSLSLAAAAVAVSMAAMAASYGASSSRVAASTSTGGTLTVALPPATNISWYIPITNASNDSVYNGWLQDQIYQPLIYLNDSYNIVWANSVASKITYNAAGTVYHVYLNPKWKWSNGTPVTSKDLMFTWNVVKAASASKAPLPWPFVGAGTGEIPFGVKSVVPNNLHEVTFTLDKPANQQWFIYNGLIQLTPMPAQAFDVKGSNWTAEAKYLGSIATNPTTAEKLSDGPFLLKSATPSQEWVLTPNPDYGGHKATVSKLIFAYEASDTAEFAALRSGTVNFGYIDPSQLGASKSLTAVGDTIFPGYSLGVFWTEMNMWPASPAKSIFDQLYVRQALQESTNQPAMVKDLYKGYGVAQYGPLPSTPLTKFYDAKAEPVMPYNLTKAKKLLTSHGWKEVNGVMTKGSQKMNFTMIYVSGDETTLQQAELMQADWEKIGIKTTLKGEPFDTFISMTSDKTNTSWQLAVGSGWDYNGPGWMPTGGQLFSSTAPSGTGYANAHENALIAATHKPYPTQAAFMKAFDQYEAYTAAQLPFLWLPNPAGIDVAGPTVVGAKTYANFTTGDPGFNFMSVK
ncbi:MAG: ABC transporter substrate-binding protein [Sulfobacillus acidophilus]|uniref:ABC transporter substrate-binding protein n=1 Tax=Sulfobacillus acidophilus TaxID=53633 RepID=A0A2T2WHL2_9FIRM|nr:MAG: ABC transporter substrate-binding protein [Sulfobacillus acidophilus]